MIKRAAVVLERQARRTDGRGNASAECGSPAQARLAATGQAAEEGDRQPGQRKAERGDPRAVGGHRNRRITLTTSATSSRCTNTGHTRPRRACVQAERRRTRSATAALEHYVEIGVEVLDRIPRPHPERLPGLARLRWPQRERALMELAALPSNGRIRAVPESPGARAPAEASARRGRRGIVSAPLR